MAKDIIKNILDENLEKHILIETLRYQPDIETFQKEEKNREIILEKRGILPQLDKYVNCALKAFLPYIQRAKDDAELIINESVFRFIRNCFFEKINIFLTYKKVNDNNFYYNGSTVQNKLNENKKIANAVIRLFIKSSKEDFQECFKIVFSHELLHIFENYSRSLNNVPTLQQAMMNDGYSQYSKSEDSDERIIELKMIKYYLSKFEMPAFIHSFRYEVENELFAAYNSDDILRVIQNSDIYKYYLTVSKLIKKYYNIYDKQEQNDVIEQWNKLSINSLNIKDFSEFQKVLKKRYVKSFHDFQNKIVRVVVDIIRMQNLTATRSPNFQNNYNKLEQDLKIKLKNGK